MAVLEAFAQSSQRSVQVLGIDELLEKKTIAKWFAGLNFVTARTSYSQSASIYCLGSCNNVSRLGHQLAAAFMEAAA